MNNSVSSSLVIYVSYVAFFSFSPWTFLPLQTMKSKSYMPPGTCCSLQGWVPAQCPLFLMLCTSTALWARLWKSKALHLALFVRVSWLVLLPLLPRGKTKSIINGTPPPSFSRMSSWAGSARAVELSSSSSKQVISGTQCWAQENLSWQPSWRLPMGLSPQIPLEPGGSVEFDHRNWRYLVVAMSA